MKDESERVMGKDPAIRQLKNISLYGFTQMRFVAERETVEQNGFSKANRIINTDIITVYALWQKCLNLDMSQLLPQIRGKVINKIKPFENKITAIFIVWAVGVYLLSVIFLNMATYNNSALLFWGTCIIMFPAAIYIAFRQHVDDKSRWYTYAGASVLPALFLIFIGYFTCLKTDILLSLLTRPTHKGILHIKGIKKNYVSRQGWDHTDIDAVYQNRFYKFEANRTSYFLLQHKVSLEVTIGRSYTGNYFVSDIHLPSSERWNARKAYLKNWIHRTKWIAVFLASVISLVIFILWIRPGFNFVSIGWKRLVLLFAVVIAGAFLLIYVTLLVCFKFTK